MSSSGRAPAGGGPDGAAASHCHRHATPVSRRDFLRTSAFGFGASALGALLASEAGAAGVTGTLAPKPPHFPATADRVILLFMTGGPSHLDTFDPKPALNRFDGQPLPPSFLSAGLDLQFTSINSALMGSPFAFGRHGQSGLEISELFPKLAAHADDLAIIRSCHHDSFVHGPAQTMLHTGTTLFGHPSAGAWAVYGLGSATDNLPAYLVMTDRAYPHSSQFSSGFLPAIYQGTSVRADGAPIANLTPPAGPDPQRRLLDALHQWNGRFQAERDDDSRLAAQLTNYELAFRMQTAAPELTDLKDEPDAIKALYGLDQAPTARFGRMCLMARRMAERGVRFIHLFNNDWDGHHDCAANHRDNAARIDQPIAGLLADLKQRGLLDRTLVVWAGEFGRTPVMEGSRGRDHSPYGYSVWMAGGGVKGGQVIGTTDDLGFRAVEERAHVHDVHATMLAALGLDHERLTYFFEGRSRRLTDVSGRVIRQVFA